MSRVLGWAGGWAGLGWWLGHTKTTTTTARRLFVYSHWAAAAAGHRAPCPAPSLHPDTSQYFPIFLYRILGLQEKVQECIASIMWSHPAHCCNVQRLQCTGRACLGMSRLLSSCHVCVTVTVSVTTDNNTLTTLHTFTNKRTERTASSNHVGSRIKVIVPPNLKALKFRVYIICQYTGSFMKVSMTSLQNSIESAIRQAKMFIQLENRLF